ncbi:MAG: SpoIIE family protein phosphatase [Armatimonadetes bacterium]|nr:SpoIIE family protein phosphatase [Armatimonadota bacterium]
MIDSAQIKTKRQPSAGFIPQEETLLFHLKRGMDAWQAQVGRQGVEMTETLRELVWELVSLCGEAVEEGCERPPRDAYRLSADIGRRITGKMQQREAVEIFRDQLLRCILNELSEYEATIPCVQTFFFAVGDAIWESYAEQLRRNLRQEKRQRLSEQLKVAKRIQQHLLPKTIPVIPGFDFAGRLRPAEEVGGDYWSIKYYEQDGVVTMKLADITGHGLAAGTLVAAVKFISGGFYRGATSPADVMERTNRVLFKETPSDILVTMIYGWLYPKTRRLRLVNAGHFPVFIAREAGFTDIPPTGSLLGLHETEYGEIEETLNPGDILVFSSDGIIESGLDRPFGADRLKEVVWANRALSAGQIADSVIDAVLSYASSPTDDLSVVVIKGVEDKVNV